MSTLNSTTPSLESLLPKNVPTPEEVRANKKREEAQKVGIGQAFKDVVNADWLPMWAFRQLDAGSVGYYDPDFTVTDQRYWPKLTEGLDPAYYEMFGEATNIDMAMKIRQQALSIQQSNQNIASMGGLGVGIRIAGNILDPVNIALGLATGGGGFLARNAARAERLIAGGLFTAASAAPTEIYRTVRDPLQDADDFMLNMGLAFGIGGIANAIPKTVRAQQAVRAGTATVEETPTSFIIRQKQLTEAPPRTPEPGLVVWQRPMQARDFINRGESPTRWNDVEVPKVKDIDFRPETADEATRYGQNVPMRSAGNSPILPTSRRQLALPEANGVPDTTQAGQPLAPGSPIGQVGVQAPDGAGSQGSLGGTGSQPQRSQLPLPTPRQASRGEYTRADAIRRTDRALEDNPSVSADKLRDPLDEANVPEGAITSTGQYASGFKTTFTSKSAWNEFLRMTEGKAHLRTKAQFKPGTVGRTADDYIGEVGWDTFLEQLDHWAGGRTRLKQVAEESLSVDPRSRFALWFEDNYPSTERTTKIVDGKKVAVRKGSTIPKEIIDSPGTSLPDGAVVKIHDQPFEVVQNEYGEMMLVQRNADGTEMSGKPLSVELAALDELPIDAGTLRTFRDPAPKIDYPSVDEMLARVEATGIDPYADVIVDTQTGDIVPMTDDIDPDTLMPRKRVEIDPETGEPMVDAVNAPDDLGDFVPPTADAPKQPWEMRPSQFRDWSYTQDFKAKRSAAESAEKLASDAVIKLEQEIGASSKGVSSVVTSLDGVSVKSFGIMQMAMAAQEQAEFDAALSKMPKEFQERHAKAVYEYELAHARTRTFEGIDTAKEMLAEYPDLAAPAELETTKVPEAHKTTPVAAAEGKPVPPEVLADYPDLKPNSPTEIPDPRTLEERLTSKIDEINRRRKNSPGVPRGDNTGGTILFAELVDLAHELALRAIRAGVRGADELGKMFDELTAGKDPEIQKVRKDIIAQADGLAAEPELIEAKYRIAKVRAEKADEIRGAKKPASASAPKSATAGNTPPPPPTETAPGVGGTPKGPGDFDLGGREYKGDATPDPAFGKGRFSMSSALQSSSSQFARWLGKVTGETAVMSKGWFDNAAEKFGDSASEATDRVFRSKITRLVAATEPMWKQYAEREKLSFIERAIRDKFKDEFNDKVGIAIRAGRSDDPIIEAARKAYASHFKDLLEHGKKYGLPGFDKIPPDETYLWRAWDNSKIAKMTAMHKHASLVELLTKAARNKNQDLDEAATREVMGYFLNALHNRQYGLDLDKNLAFTSARDTVESVIDALGLERNKAQDLINRAKGRMVLDENASIETAAGTLRISDLLDNNAETLAHVYARNVVGASHMQEVFRAAEGHWGRKVNSLAELLDLIRRDGAAVGADKTRLEYDISKAKAIGEAILGHRSAQATYWTKASIAIRGINHLARSGSFAIAQIPEAGRVVAGGGIQAAINDMSVMKDILTSVYSGNPSTPLLQEIQEMWALGTEPLVNHPVKRFDFREAGDQFLNYSQFNRQLNKAQYWASNISGMTYIQNVQQKWAGAAFVNTWANMKGLPSKARLTTLGMDETTAQQIIDNIRKHATTETGPLGVRVKQLNIQNWDKDAASKFIVAGDKWTRNAVQQNNVALYSEWMTSDAGKVLVQFRSFVVQAYEKQFLQPGQILIASRGRDFQAWMDFMVPVFLGGLAYIAQTHMNSVGRADRDKYLKDMLSDEKIALGAFNRGGAASILPMATDWVSDSFGYGKPFGYARTSGMESHPLLGNPTFDVMVNLPTALRGARAAVDPDYNATQSDMRNLRKIFPGQNLPLVKNILDYYQTRLPKERE